MRMSLLLLLILLSFLRIAFSTSSYLVVLSGLQRRVSLLQGRLLLLLACLPSLHPARTWLTRRKMAGMLRHSE